MEDSLQAVAWLPCAACTLFDLSRLAIVFIENDKVVSLRAVIAQVKVLAEEAK